MQEELIPTARLNQGHYTSAIAVVVAPQTSFADTVHKGTTVLVSTFPDGSPADGGSASVSADGRYIAFDSWDRLVPEDTDDKRDVYRKDMVTGQTILVSAAADGWMNFEPSISGDGNKVAYLRGVCFYVDLENFVRRAWPSCIGGRAHVKDIAAGTDVPIHGNDDRYTAAATKISRDGKWATVVRDSGTGSNVIATNTTTGGFTQIAFLCLCTTEASEGPAISASGRFISYRAYEDTSKVYVHDRDSDQDGIFDEAGQVSNTLVGISPNGSTTWSKWPAISDDGKTVVFTYASVYAANLGQPSDLQVYARDLVTGRTTLVSQSTQGLFTSGITDVSLGNLVSVSGDGSKVAFAGADNHLAADPNPLTDVFVHDRTNAATYYASTLPEERIEPSHRYRPYLSADGRYLAFETTLSYSFNDQESSRDFRRVYLRDLAAGCEIVCIDEASPRLVPDPPNLTYAVAVDSRQPSPSYSPPLYAGLGYQVKVSGSYLFSTGPYLADAECSTLDGVTWAPSNFGDTYLDLLIDGSQVNWAPEPGTESASDPACSTTHTYVTTITGQYRPFGFQVSDAAYHDNAGWVTVVIKPAQ